MIFASNREAEWIRSTPDIRECYGKIFDKESGASVLMLYPAKNGIMLTISKMRERKINCVILLFIVA